MAYLISKRSQREVPTMTLIPIEELFPGGWDVIATRVEALRRNLWGTPPDIPAVSIATLPIPDATVAKIRAKNLPRVRDELTIEEMNADTSPFRGRHAYFDDQMLEVICAISDKYEPHEFIDQLVILVRLFLNESAALRGGYVGDRVTESCANRCIWSIRDAVGTAVDPYERRTLLLLAVNSHRGEKSRGYRYLSPEMKEFVAAVTEQERNG